MLIGETGLIRYSEGITILYQNNTFDFNHIDTILNLSQTTLPDRLRCIRRMSLHWYFMYPMDTRFPDWPGPPHSTEAWDAVCHVLAGLTELRELYLHLGGHPTRPRTVKRLIKSLKAIRTTETFDVFLPRVDGSWPGRLPFRLIQQAQLEDSTTTASCC